MLQLVKIPPKLGRGPNDILVGRIARPSRIGGRSGTKPAQFLYRHIMQYVNELWRIIQSVSMNNCVKDV